MNKIITIAEVLINGLQWKSLICVSECNFLPPFPFYRFHYSHILSILIQTPCSIIPVNFFHKLICAKCYSLKSKWIFLYVIILFHFISLRSFSLFEPTKTIFTSINAAILLFTPFLYYCSTLFHHRTASMHYFRQKSVHWIFRHYFLFSTFLRFLFEYYWYTNSISHNKRQQFNINNEHLSA